MFLHKLFSEKASFVHNARVYGLHVFFKNGLCNQSGNQSSHSSAQISCLRSSNHDDEEKKIPRSLCIFSGDFVASSRNVNVYISVNLPDAKNTQTFYIFSVLYALAAALAAAASRSLSFVILSPDFSLKSNRKCYISSVGVQSTTVPQHRQLDIDVYLFIYWKPKNFLFMRNAGIHIFYLRICSGALCVCFSLLWLDYCFMLNNGLPSVNPNMMYLLVRVFAQCHYYWHWC